jgi:Flp pilus assembly protein TadD
LKNSGVIDSTHAHAAPLGDDAMAASWSNYRALMLRNVSSRSRVRLVLGALLLFALVLIIYFPILPGSFVMDDMRLVAGAANPLVTGDLSWRTVWFQTDFPLTLCVWKTEWTMWGDHPLGYHAVNIALQAISAVLLWRVLARLEVPGAWLGAAIFAVHPVCVGSVGRIAELKNTLSLPFFLLSLWAYLGYEKQTLYRDDAAQGHGSKARGTLWFAVSFISFLLALLSKTTVIALPVVLLGSTAWQRGRIARRDLLHTIPYFILALSFGLMSVWFQKYQALAGQVIASQTLVERLSVAGRNFWFYCGKAFLPVNLTVFYPRWGTEYSLLAALLPAVLIVAVFLACWRFRRNWGKHALFGLGAFAVLLFPALGFFDAQCFTKFQVSDHLQYLPLVALLSLFGAVIASLPGRKFAWPAAVIVISILSILSFKRAQVFSTQESLLRDTLAKNPKAWPVYNDLGAILFSRGKIAEAAGNFKTSMELNPNEPESLSNLALMDLLQGHYQAAAEEYREAIHMKPDSVALHENMANALQNLGKFDEAIGHLKIALRSSPKIQTRVTIAGLRFLAHDFRGSVSEYRKVLELDPDNVESLNNLAYVLATCPDANVRNGGNAVQLSEHACRLTHFKRARLVKTLSAAYAAQGRIAEAVEANEKASRLQEMESSTADTEKSEND